MFEVTKSCAHILEDAWSIKMTDDELAYIAIHLGGELEREEFTTAAKKRVIVICNEGVGIQKLLMRQCQNYLTNCTIEAVFTSEQFHSVSDILEADMIISTSDALESKIPIMIVHPILNDDDIIKLVRFSKNQGLQIESHFSQELMKCLQPYVSSSRDRDMLKAQIEKLVGQELVADR